MFLLFTIVILNSITAFANELLKPIKTFLLRPSSEEESIQAQIEELQKSLNQISMREEYSTYVKTERKIIVLQKQLSDLRLKNSLKNTAINYGTSYVFQGILTFILFIISLWYRYTPVLVFDGNFNFSPFNSVINFPTGVNNAISVPVWIFISNFSIRSLASSIRSIKC